MVRGPSTEDRHIEPPVSVEASFPGRMIFCAEVAPRELRGRAVRLAAGHRDQHETEYAAVWPIAAKPAAARQSRCPCGCARPGGRGSAARGEQRGARGDRAAAGQGGRTPPGWRDPQGGVGFLRGRARPAAATLVTFTGEHEGASASSRSAACWLSTARRSHRAPAAPPRAGRRRPGRCATHSSAPGSAGCGRRTTRSTARTRPGWS
jgi:hypothetical protein